MIRRGELANALDLSRILCVCEILYIDLSEILLNNPGG